MGLPDVLHRFIVTNCIYPYCRSKLIFRMFFKLPENSELLCTSDVHMIHNLGTIYEDDNQSYCSVMVRLSSSPFSLMGKVQFNRISALTFPLQDASFCIYIFHRKSDLIEKWSKTTQERESCEWQSSRAHDSSTWIGFIVERLHDRGYEWPSSSPTHKSRQWEEQRFTVLATISKMARVIFTWWPYNMDSLT